MTEICAVGRRRLGAESSEKTRKVGRAAEVAGLYERENMFGRHRGLPWWLARPLVAVSGLDVRKHVIAGCTPSFS